MNKLNVFFILFSFLFLFGCTQTDLVIPFSTSQLIAQSTDLNYSKFVNGDYNGLFLIIDNNKLSVYDLNFFDEDIPWSSLINFPSGCGFNQAVKIVGSSLVCVDLPVDTNFQTAGYDFDDYALLDGSNQPFTGDILIRGTTGSQFSIQRDSDAGFGPHATLYHNSASPTVNDRIGYFDFYANDSNVAKQLYGFMSIDILDPTSGSIDSQFQFHPTINGSYTNSVLNIGGSTAVQIKGDFPNNTHLNVSSNDYTLFAMGARGTGTNLDKGYISVLDTGVAKIILDSAGGIKIKSDSFGYYDGADDDFHMYFNGVLERVVSPFWNISSTGRWDIHTTSYDNLIIGEDAGNDTMTGANNVLLGKQAGKSITSGQYNFFLGYNTGQAVTTGSYNTSVGILNSISNQTGSSNTNIGYGAGYTGTASNNTNIGSSAGYGVGSGGDNVFIGYGAGQYVGDPSYTVAIGRSAGQWLNANNNTYVGYSSGSGVTTGQFNTGFGRESGAGSYPNTTGSYNSMFGARSGYALTTGSSNVFLGYGAGGRQTTGSNLFIVDNTWRANTATELTNAILYGVMASTPADQDLRINADVNIGTTTIKQDGNILMQSPDGTSWNCGVDNLGTFNCS